MHTRKNLRPKKIPARKKIGPTRYLQQNVGTKKYPQKNILDPQNIHEKNFRTYQVTMAHWRETHAIHGI